MKLQDFGFTLYQQLYAVTDDALNNHPDVVVAGLRSELIGKQLILQHKDEALQLSLTKYSKDLNQDPTYAQQAQDAYFTLSTSAATTAHGIAYMGIDDVAKNVATLKQLGLEIPTSSYTTKILDQVYSQGLTLI
jgi:D-hexose-6-phosphate mutarotase